MKRTILIISGILLTLSSLSSCVNTPQVEEEKTFKVTWKNEDGTILEVDSNVKEGELPSFDGNTPSKDNDEYYSYSFKGWNKELEPVYSDITYIAQYEKIELVYTVTWENYDGTILEVDENVKKGSIPEYNGETPTRENDENYRYSFKEWDKVLNPVEENITFKAVFDTAPSIYTVKFLNYDGTLLKEYNDVKFNDYCLYFGDIPKKESNNDSKYIFKSWEPNLSRIRDDIVFTASYSEIDKLENLNINRTPKGNKGQIFIFGEAHGDQGILEEELKIRDNYYNNYGLRHLFIEFSIIWAGRLNLYMKSPNDDIWNSMFIPNINSNMGTIHYYNFIKTIKEKYPETVFHGIDGSGGGKVSNIDSYVDNLIDLGIIDSSQYYDTKEQLIGANYFTDYRNTKEGELFREEQMAKNIINEWNKLGNINIVGFFGAQHTNKNGTDFIFKDVPNTGQILSKNLGDEIFYSEDLTSFANGDRTKPDKDFIENELGYKDPSSIDLNSCEYIYI